jgi:RNA polymerase sigma-70 factor (ECF subfamily)
MQDPNGTLYRRIRRHDSRALEELIQSHARRLLNMIRCILGGLGSVEDAEEVLADTFCTVWYDIEKYDPERGSLTTWIYMRAKYAALDRRRQLKRRGAVPLLEELGLPEEPRESMDKAEKWDLHEILCTLPELERELVYRRYFLQESLSEIAEEVDYSVHAVRNRLWRTRRRLADMVQPLVDPEAVPAYQAAPS